MAQIKSNYEEVRVPFTQMSFTPDVPSTALGPNEYNDGLNVESDVRGIRSVAGDLEILDTCPDTPTFITGGFRQSGEFWFIVATVEGKWYATNGTTVTWYDITPSGGVGTYAQNTNITEAWNGTIPFFNDTQNPPMFLPDEPNAVLIMYSNLIPASITNITYVNPTTQQIEITNHFTSTGSSISPIVGTGTGILTIGTLVTGTVAIYEYITGTSIPSGTKILQNLSGSGSGSTWLVNLESTLGPINIDGSVYLTAPFNTGDKIVISDVDNYFNGIYTVVSSTTSTINYTAIPGAAYPGGGKVASLYNWNYNPNWTSYYANFMRLYSTPNVGSILVAGNLTVTNNDATNSTSIYPVTVQWSQAFALNQAPKTWEPTITNVANQLEVPLRGPALDAFPCNGQFFLCSYWDTVVFSPINYSTTSAPILGVRLYNQGRGLLSSNCWANTDKLVYGVDARDIWVFDGTDFQGLGNQKVKNWFFDQLDPQYYDRVYMEVNSQKNQVEIYYPDSQAIGGVPNKMLSYRYDLQTWNPPREVSSATFSCESPIWVYDDNTNTWSPNLGSRTVVYARGVEDQKIVQKDYGYSWIDGSPIDSYFRRDNIKLLKDYSGKLMVHRVLPEAVNMGGIPFTSDYNKQITPSTGNISVKIEGAYSVGSSPIASTDHTMTLDTDNPWIQVDQNSRRVNSIELSNSSNTDIWMTSATTWQITQIEDDR